MKQWTFLIVMSAFIAGCGKHKSEEPELQQNTEEYFRAHGIVPGQPNELRIGGTLFRFPAGVGLNPYTETGIRLLADGGKGIPLDKEPRKIVKGQADSVTIYLDTARNFSPGPEPFPSYISPLPWIGVLISKHDGKPDSPSDFEKIVSNRTVVEHPELGLKEYVSTNRIYGLIYQSARTVINGNAVEPLLIRCDPDPKGFTHPSGDCGTSFLGNKGQYVVTFSTNKSYFLEHWRDIYPAVVHFVDSVVAK